MARPVMRTLNLYAVHGRSGEEPIDYDEFFHWLATLDAAATARPVTPDLQYAVEGAQFVAGRFFARIVAGTPEELPTFFDYRTGELVTGETPPGKWLARAARVVIDPSPDRRMLVLEMARSGVNVTLLERYLSRLASARAEARTRFDLPPVPSESLLTEINSLERIREAAVTASRPNMDWDDTSNDLAELAAKSSGEEAEAVVRAAREGSLSKRSGIVRIILDSLGAQTPNLRDFRIVGRPPQAGKDVTITSKRHQRRAFVPIDPRAPLVESDERVVDAAASLIEEASASIVELRAESAGRAEA